MEVGEVFVVGKDLHREWGSVEVVSPGFQSPDNGEEFSVIDIVVSFGWGEQLRKVGAGMPVTIGVCLEEDGAGGIFGGVCYNGEGGGEVWKVKDWFQREEGFESVKGGLAGGRPVPREVFLGEVNESLGNIGVIRNETLVEVCEAKEGPDVFDFLGGSPTGDPI